MPIEIPYSFIAGTKAKASEVNADFDAIASFVDALEVSTAEIEALAESLQSSKANKNGDLTEIFKMANATTDYDGVNLRTLKNLTNNSMDIIRGFVLSKQSNISVNATAGSCWDSTYVEMIISNTSLIAEQSNLSPNSTYYVYVVSDKETGDCQLVISLSNATPDLPIGYEYFRQLGKIYTDANGYISRVDNNNRYTEDASFHSLSVGLAVGSNDISSYIPSDNYVYNVWVANNLDSKGSSATTSISTDIFPSTLINRLDGDAGRSTKSCCLVCVPVGPGRTITISRVSTLVGYMKA